MPPPTSHRPRRRLGASPSLSRFTAALDELDAAVTARRRRETTLLTEYATATDATEAVVARRDAALADLARQADQVRATADEQLGELEANQGAVLVALNADRSAEELHQLIGLPLKRVRTLLRKYRPDPPDEPSSAGPLADTAAEHGTVDDRARTGGAPHQPSRQAAPVTVDSTAPPVDRDDTGDGEAEPPPRHTPAPVPSPPSDSGGDGGDGPARPVGPDRSPPEGG